MWPLSPFFFISDNVLNSQGSCLISPYDAQSWARTCSFYATLRQCPRIANLRLSTCSFSNVSIFECNGGIERERECDWELKDNATVFLHLHFVVTPLVTKYIFSLCIDLYMRSLVCERESLIQKYTSMRWTVKVDWCREQSLWKSGRRSEGDGGLIWELPHYMNDGGW